LLRGVLREELNRYRQPSGETQSCDPFPEHRSLLGRHADYAKELTRDHSDEKSPFRPFDRTSQTMVGVNVTSFAYLPGSA